MRRGWLNGCCRRDSQATNPSPLKHFAATSSPNKTWTDADLNDDAHLRRSPSDDANARPKRKRDDGELHAAIPESPAQPTGDIRRLIGDFDDAIPAMCDKVDKLSSRLRCTKQAKKFLDSPVAKKVLDMFNSLTGQREEYRTAVQDVEASLNTIDGIAAFALRKVMADIQKEADGVLGGNQDQPIMVADDGPAGTAKNNHPDADSTESTVRPNNAPTDIESSNNADIY
ncbi:hypothetical protein N7501_007518 [Penicillium viridicatum]|nr:hypothetical protein N7501_007518 [Penicillium viridicatum]